MDREYLENHLVAYLDGELPEKEIAAFEAELRQHPDLLEQLEQMRNLNALARKSEPEMPAPGYFENLAERIDSEIARVAKPRTQSFWSRLATMRGRVVAIAGSAAAVLLIAFVSSKLYEPAVKKYEALPPPAQMAQPAADSVLTEPQEQPEMMYDEVGQQEEAAKVTTPSGSGEEVVADEAISTDMVEADKLKQPEAVPDSEGPAAAPPLPESEPATGSNSVTRDVDVPTDGAVQIPTAERSIQLTRPKGQNRETALDSDDSIERLGALRSQGAIEMRSLTRSTDSAPPQLTEAQFDSLIAVADATDDAYQAADYAWQKAAAHRSERNIDDATRRIEPLVERYDGARQRALQNWLTDLRKWQAELDSLDTAN